MTYSSPDSTEPFECREFVQDAFRSMEVQICGQTRTVQFAVSDHGGDHPTTPAVAIDWSAALDLAAWIVSLTRAPAQTPCTVHDTDINGHCQRCGETILRISKVTPPQAASAAEECARIAESHVGSGKHPEPEYDDPSYDEACRDIAKAIRDAMGAKA